MMKYLIFIVMFLATFLSGAHEEHTMPKKSMLAISVVFDAQGNLWRVSVKDDVVVVDKSGDLGKTFSAPVKVNVTSQKIGADGEARPKIAIGPEGNIYLTWTEGLKAPFAGYIWFARSIDGGKSFENPYIVHQDRAEITHRFDALNVAPNGSITVTWIDKRDLIAAKAAKKSYDGAAIYYAVSTDKGASFKPEQKLADSTCECCRIVTTNKPDGTVVALWRHVFQGSERDHMIAEIPQKSDQIPVAKRATFGHWKIDGCPHHGAAITSGGDGQDWWGYHMAYFDGNDKKPGLYYGRMDGVAWTVSPPKKFGDNAKQAGHPALLNKGESVWLTWREIKDGRTSILCMFSDDGGKSWSAAKTLKSTSQKADYPILIQDKNQPYLVWNTQHDGLQIISLQNSAY
ncbi:MAG TPA: sialidase family protein [Methylophilaceae bacterium]|nr:sialidase family protein [Methylophilaceae bacterium]